MPAKRKTSKTTKRTAIEPHKGDRRYVRRNKQGQFKKEVNSAVFWLPIAAANQRRKSNPARATAATPLAG
jgi:hypothetical protein